MGGGEVAPSELRYSWSSCTLGPLSTRLRVLKRHGNQRGHHMLEAMRENSKGVLTTVLFGIIIAVFINNFGPQSSGCGAGLSSVYAARVKNEYITDGDFRY